MVKNCMRVVMVLAGMMGVNISWSQMPVPLEIVNTASAHSAENNLLQYAVHKQLPAGYENETLEALAHFPELKNVAIKFRVKKSFSTLKTRPTFLSMFMPKGHRAYVITISNKTTAKLMPLMFAHLGSAARTGVVGHELSHVVDMSSKNNWQCFKIAVGHFSARYMDHFEYNTDMICIRHGLGKDLEAWSDYIRKTMHTVFWRGADYVNKGDKKYERYMNPSTIEKNISAAINSSTEAGTVQPGR